MKTLRARKNYEWKEAAPFSPLIKQGRQDTKPELELRTALHLIGLRFRLGRRIAGFRPDLVLPQFKVAIFVDGCWWHQCPHHKHWVPTGENGHLWVEKFKKNVARDVRANELLTNSGYFVFRTWECEIRRNLPGVVEQFIASAIIDSAKTA